MNYFLPDLKYHLLYLFILISLSNFGPVPHYFSYLEWSCKSLLIIPFFQTLLAISLHFIYFIRHPFRILTGNCIKFIYKFGEILYIIESSHPEPVCPSINLELLFLFSVKIYSILHKCVVHLLLDSIIIGNIFLCYYDGIFKCILIGYFRGIKATINSHMLALYPPK